MEPTQWLSLQLKEGDGLTLISLHIFTSNFKVGTGNVAHNRTKF